MEHHLNFWFNYSSQAVAFLEPILNSEGDIEGFCYKSVNQSFTKLIRQTREELIGQMARTAAPHSEFLLPLITVMQTGNEQRILKQQPHNATVWHEITLNRMDNLAVVIVEDVSEQKRSEYSLQRRLDMESLLSTISSRFVALNVEEVGDYIVDALKQISELIGAERASVFLFSEDYQKGRFVYEWCATDIWPRQDTIQTRPQESFDWMRPQLENGDIIHLQLDELTAQQASEQAFFSFLSVRAMIAIPLVLEQKTQGFIGFYTINKLPSWGTPELTLLKTFGTLISNVFLRLQQRTALLRANQRLEGLHAIDQALQSYRMSDQSPLLIAMKYIYFMVPCNQITVSQINYETDSIEVQCQMLDGNLTLNPQITYTNAATRIQALFRQSQAPDQLIYCPDLQQDSSNLILDLLSTLPDGRSTVTVPLYSQKQYIGVFTLLSDKPHFFSEEDLQIIQELAGQLAIVLHQQRLDNQLKQYTDQLERRVEERTQEIQRISTLQQAILRHAGQAIISTDIRGIIQTANQACEQLLGYRPEELIGQLTYMKASPTDHSVPVIVYESPSQHQLPSKFFTNMLATEGYFSCECNVLTKTGKYTPVWLNASVLLDDDGAIIGYVGICTDISALKKADVQLRTLNQRFQLATQAAGQGLWERDLQTDALVWDDTMWQLIGEEYRQPDWTFDKLTRIIHPDDLLDFQDSRKQCITENNASIRRLFRIIRPDATIRYIESHGVITYDEKGQPQRATGVAWDVTQRKQAEAALQESEQRFREIAEHVDEIFWIHALDPFRLLYINPAYERILNQDCQRLYNDPLSFIDFIFEEDKPTVMEAMQRYVLGEEVSLQCRLIKWDHSQVWTSVRTFNVQDETGKVIRQIGIANDITSQKEKEFVLQQALLHEKELNQLKSQFVSTASHEFRTPLATIQSSVDLIRLYLDLTIEHSIPSIHKNLNIIEKEIDHFSSLLSDLLTIGKIESRKVKFYPAMVDIVGLCKETITTHFSHRSDGRKVNFTVEGLPCNVYLDSKLISHVIVNLLSNAFKFSKTNPTLRLFFNQDTLVIEAIDQGIGIPANELSEIGQAFFRASNTVGIQGTGLGLKIVREFVELHRGRFTIQSEEKKNTICSITIPIEATNLTVYPVGRNYV